MQGNKDNQQARDENDVMKISALTVIGNRDDQQDSFGFWLNADDGMAIICDGMGGHEGGKKASSIAVEKSIELFNKCYRKDNPVDFLQYMTSEANKAVLGLCDENGRKLDAGSTLVMLYIADKKLYWNSVGDSRAYLYRNGEFVQITTDQNYGTVLNEQLSAGIISKEQFLEEQSRADALISYLGMQSDRLIDFNDTPFQLISKDKIIIMTDGLYRLVPDQDIANIIGNFADVNEALSALEIKAQRYAIKSNLNRDNMTAILISIK